MKNFIFLCLFVIEGTLSYLYYTLVVEGIRVMEPFIFSVLALILTIIIHRILNKLNFVNKSKKYDCKYAESKKKLSDKIDFKQECYLERAFGYSISDFFLGNKSTFDLLDAENIMKYLETKLGKTATKLLYGKHSVLVEIDEKKILLELVERKSNFSAERYRCYNIFANGVLIRETREILNIL
jgi:hypothetical protein